LEHFPLAPDNQDIRLNQEKVDTRKKRTPLPTQNTFSLLASPSPDPVPAAKEKGEQYYIQSQNDLYQTSEWIKFLIPWGIGALLMVIWQFLATLLCVFGTQCYSFLTDTPRKAYVGCGKALGKNRNGRLGVD